MGDMRVIYLGRNGFTRLLTRVIACFGVYSSCPAWQGRAQAQDVLQEAPYPVRMTQLEYVDPSEGGRPLNLMLIYPAAPTAAAAPFKIFLSTNLRPYKDAPVVLDGLKHPLVMFSHGAGGNGSRYAWFGEYLASHGYLVAPGLVKVCERPNSIAPLLKFGFASTKAPVVKSYFSKSDACARRLEAIHAFV
jgi:hypothetical protein